MKLIRLQSKCLLLVKKILKYWFDSWKNLVLSWITINMVYFGLFLKFRYYLVSLSIICLQSLVNNLHIVITSLTRFTSLQDSFDHFLLTALKVKHKRTLRKIFSRRFPSVKVLKIARKSINQKISILAYVSLHCRLQELNCYMTRHNFSVKNDLLNDRPKLRSLPVLFFSQ